jgi:O-antigen/teichoic acid export membrane protein
VGGIIAIAGMYFLALGAPGFPGLVHGPLWLYLIPLSMVPSGLVIEYWGAILRGMNHILLLNGAEVGTKVAALVLVLIFVWQLQLDVAGAVWAGAIVDMSTVALMVALLMHVGVWGRPSFDRLLWGRTVRFALPVHSGTIAAYLNYRVDEFFIAALLPPEQLGFYVIAVGLVERLWILPSAVTTALLPHLTNSRERDSMLPAAISRHVVIWTGVLCLLVFILGDLIVRTLFSSAFAPAVAPLRWLLSGIFALSVGKVLVVELLAREKPRYTVWASGIACLVNIIGNLLLVPRMGISGAALASSISYSLLSLILAWYYLQETGASWMALVPCRNDLLTYTALWHRATHPVSLESGTS